MTTEQYQKIVAEIEKEFSQFLAKAESDSVQPLAKAEEEDKSDKKEESEPKAEEKKDESPAAEASEEKKEESKEEAPKAEEKKDDDADHGYDDEDVEEMHKMYGSMSKSELNLHKGAMEKCWMAKCGEMTMGKSEQETIVEIPTTTEDTSLIKSQNESLTKENEELKKNVAELVNAMASFVTKKAPARKAVTELQYLNKTEEEVKVEAEKQLTKTEVTQILSKKAQEPTLSKSDREAIDKYYLGKGDLNLVRHLIKA